MVHPDFSKQMMRGHCKWEYLASCFLLYVLLGGNTESQLGHLAKQTRGTYMEFKKETLHNAPST